MRVIVADHNRRHPNAVDQVMKLLWVDDRAPLREAVDDLQWMEAKTLAEAQSRLEREPDIHIVVVALDLADGLEAIRLVREAAPAATLIALSTDERRGTVMGAISAGAAGFIVKTAPVDTVRAALRMALDGGIPLPVGILERRAPDRPGYGTWIPTPRTPGMLGYTPDEADLLRLLIQGRTEPLIAQTTGMAESTVKTHLAAIFRRLGASSRSQAVLEVARLGLRFGPVQGAVTARASSIASP
jgi:DNA-binding NarL/FixJ family response regulator